MIAIGEKIIQLRKQHQMSQAEFAKKVGVSRTIIGNYERNTNMPSVEILLSMANTFNVSIDYIIGEGQLSSYDKQVLRRIEEIELLDTETKDKLFFLIDNVIQNFKTKQAFAS